MAFKKTHRKYRRAYKPKRKSWKKYSRKSTDPFPLSTVVKLKYVQSLSIAGGALGVPAVYTFRANSIYDPDYNAGGHQPLHRDRYASLYNHYTVLGAKMKLTAWSETNNTTYGSIVGIALDDNSSISNSLVTIVEGGRKTMTHKFLRVTADAERSMVKLTKKFSAKNFFGIKDLKDNLASYGAVQGGNPADEAYFNIFWGHIDGSTVLDTLNCLVEIEYIVHMSEPVDQVGS